MDIQNAVICNIMMQILKLAKELLLSIWVEDFHFMCASREKNENTSTITYSFFCNDITDPLGVKT